MYPYSVYLTEQIAAHRQTDMRKSADRRAAAHQARRAGLAGPSRRASFRPGRSRRSHPMRRRAGYALISIGLRLAYAAGDD